MRWPFPLPVPFSDVDHAGIVFFARVFGYCHLAFEEWYFQSLHETFDKAFVAHGYGTPVVRTEASYVSPMRHGDRFSIHVHAEQVGLRSFTLGYRLFGMNAGGEDIRHLSDVRITHAAVNLREFGSMELPDALRKALGGAIG